MADPTIIKPGWKTSEFWLHVGVAALIAALSAVNIDTAGVNPLVASVWKLIVPLALTLLAKNYGDIRVQKNGQALQLAAAQTLAERAPSSPS